MPARDDQPADPHLRFLKPGVHDHHVRAARTDVEQARARQQPWRHWPDDRCWWDGNDPTGRG